MNRNQQNAINRMQRWPTKEQQRFVSELAEWMVTKPEALDRKVMELARQVNPVAAKFLSALDEATPEAALAKLETPVTLEPSYVSEQGTVPAVTKLVHIYDEIEMRFESAKE